MKVKSSENYNISFRVISKIEVRFQSAQISAERYQRSGIWSVQLLLHVRGAYLTGYGDR